MELSRATKHLSSHPENKIVKTLWHLRTLSLSSQTTYAKKIKRLNKNTNVDDPTGTKKYILNLDRSSKYKQSLLLAYRHYCIANNIKWKEPSIKVQSAPIIVPTEERIDKIINRATLKYVVTFQISKHGLRPCEVSKIVLRDIDFQRELTKIYKGIYPLVKSGGHNVINVADVWAKGEGKKPSKRIPIHIYVCEAMTDAGFQLKNTIIWNRLNIVNRIGIFGWPSNYITMGTTFEYILDFWKPK